ncbi:hypothetical protein INT43_002053 [Umbelopsis isabellina]|uniref:Cas1p 10 TM acyl transferase domain-containing protein n=1 Tax=Mortierella isabellina TaxID=91625 RepID=A0A8H7PSS1_MORIS|nr:hypothetical protein INT43_002053 [Umbelopsis isabellina]
MHNYKPAEIETCFKGSRILFVGDSVVRNQFYGVAKLIDPEVDTSGEKHTDRRLDYEEAGFSLEFWWDPYLNSTKTIEMLAGQDSGKSPNVAVFGAGLWNLRYQGDSAFNTWKIAVNRVFDAARMPSPIAHSLLLSPVEEPDYSHLNPERTDTINANAVREMNQYLQDQADMLNASPARLIVPFAWNKMIDGVYDQSDDGLHFDSAITSMQAEILLNFKCNDQLPKHFPMSNTCCYRYPITRWYQNIIFFVILISIPMGLYIRSLDNSPIGLTLYSYLPSEKVLTAAFTFGIGVVYMYFCDRTTLLAKAQKQYDPIAFGFLILLAFSAGMATLKSSKREGDQGFLNRDQTDEWKGWMQIVILIYHYLGASSTSGIYNPVRVLVAAYLFQTGYGHFFFFYKKGDFGIGRFMNVMVRLNLLTVVLEYAMDTNYLSYYFTPLVSFWFCIIWLMMYVGNSYNKNPLFLLVKLVASMAFTTFIIKWPGVLENIFSAFEFLFNIHWDAVEWRFRLNLDLWIVYIGMICAYITIKFGEVKFSEKLYWPMVKNFFVFISALAMVWFFWFELSQPGKTEYNIVHPYISWIPIVAFAILRNASMRLRNTSSQLFIFIGKCSLETFIGQFHMWLVGDTKGLLVVLQPAGWVHGLGWWINLVVSTALFIYVAYWLSQSTGELTSYLCSKSQLVTETGRHHNATGTDQAVPLLPTTMLEERSSVDNDEGIIQQPKRSWITVIIDSIWGDLRWRSLSLLLFLVVINHFA